ncbi:hypothetical protein [Niallia sp. MER TA 168]|uniref:hypothetical protein n=1 Tax=Niallia sp. MER TA 168 TaxID=2939568 RepID=UPI002040BC0D|nr:hypothetical protein [Niallia sp. MER TA 168]MCM3363680.1 hypothetical protein [Niallia sp. MER TA 168]
MVFWFEAIGGILAFGAVVFYYASLGRMITAEEKIAGRDLTYKIHPFTGSAKTIDESTILTNERRLFKMVPVVRTLEKECFIYRYFFIYLNY